MKIGIVSDTHMPSRGKNLPRALVQGLTGVELILHAGDWVDAAVIPLIEGIAPVESVVGNNDGKEIRQRYPLKQILTLKNFRIGLIHGDGYRKTTEERAYEAFAEDHVDAIVFGHSHTPFIETRNGILLFNPGSPTDKRRQPRYSYGILTLSLNIQAKHYFYDDKS